MKLKKTMSWILLGISLTAIGCGGAGREIRRVEGCDSRLAVKEKRVACRECVSRPRPHVYLPDRPEGERCVPR